MIRSLVRSSASTGAVFEHTCKSLLEQNIPVVNNLIDNQLQFNGNFNLMKSSLLGLSHLQQNKLKEADDLYTETVGYLKTGMPLGTTSDSFTDIAGSMNDHAITLGKMHRYDEGLALVKRALHMTKKSYRRDAHLILCLEGNYIEIMRAKVTAMHNTTSSKAEGEEALTRAKALLISLNNSTTSVKKYAGSSSDDAIGPWSTHIYSTLRNAKLYFTIGHTVACLGLHKGAIQEAILYYNKGCEALFHSLKDIDMYADATQGTNRYNSVRILLQHELNALVVLLKLQGREVRPHKTNAPIIQGTDYLKVLSEIIYSDSKAVIDWNCSTDNLDISLSNNCRDGTASVATIPFELSGLALLDAKFYLT